MPYTYTLLYCFQRNISGQVNNLPSMAFQDCFSLCSGLSSQFSWHVFCLSWVLLTSHTSTLCYGVKWKTLHENCAASIFMNKISLDLTLTNCAGVLIHQLCVLYNDNVTIGYFHNTILGFLTHALFLIILSFAFWFFFEIVLVCDLVFNTLNPYLSCYNLHETTFRSENPLLEGKVFILLGFERQQI